MKKYISILIFTAIAFLYACNSKNEANSDSEQAVGEAGMALEAKVMFAPPAISEDENVKADRSKTEVLTDQASENIKKIIKDGNISVKTDDVNTSKKSIDDLVKKLNAYYENENLQNSDLTVSYDLKIRIPAENFEKLISSIENGKDEIKSKNIQARDITEEFVDIETRLASKRDYLKRYKELLSKASTVKDILAIEENIRALQEEIESKEGRLKYLGDQVAFSTLDINLYQEKAFVYKPEPQDKFSERVKTSLSNGWTSVVDFVLWWISIWPYIIFLPIAIFVIRRIISNRKKS